MTDGKQDHYNGRTEEDFSLEGNLRPQSLDEYIGQQKTKDTLKIYIEAANRDMTHWTMYCLRPPGWEKQHCPRSLPTKWEHI